MKNRAFWYEATETTPASIHVHCNRVKKGENYLIAKTDDPNFVSITGKLFDNNFGMDRVTDKWIHVSLVKPFVKHCDASECLTVAPNYGE